VKRITVIVIMVLGLLLIPVGVSAACKVEVVGKSGNGTWIGNTWQVGMFPGEMKATTLTLHNPCSESLDVEVSVSPGYLDSGNLTFELDKTTFTMLRRSYSEVTLEVRASSSATPGTYSTNLTVKSEEADNGDGNGEGDGGWYRPPKIYDPEVIDITQTSAKVKWRTDRVTTGEVTYWTALGGKKVEDKVKSKDHSILLSGLKPNTQYTFYVTAEDDDRARNTSSYKTFRTLEEKKVTPPPPTPPIPPTVPILPPVVPPPVAPSAPPVTPPVIPPLPITPLPERGEFPWILIFVGLLIAGGIGVFRFMKGRKVKENET